MSPEHPRIQLNITNTESEVPMITLLAKVEQEEGNYFVPMHNLLTSDLHSLRLWTLILSKTIMTFPKYKSTALEVHT